MRIIIFTSLLFAVLRLTAHYATSITVAKDGSGDFSSIQEAINATKAFPDTLVTIFIKKGVYEEKVRIYGWNSRLKLVGEDRDRTIITWDDHFDRINLGRNSTFHTYTLQVESNDVVLENLTIQNTAGPVGQAIALSLGGDRISVKNCTITGYQDTLYLAGEGFRQYFENCHIEGSTDFIFGQATAFFSHCTIHSKSNSFVTAASTPESSAFGFVFHECKLTADEGVSEVLLGRPWRAYAKTVFLNCWLGSHIHPAGWDNWGSRENEKTAYYAEFNSSGAGANSSKRASWSHQLKATETSSYTVEKVLGDWNPG